MMAERKLGKKEKTNLVLFIDAEGTCNFKSLGKLEDVELPVKYYTKDYYAAKHAEKTKRRK